MAEPLVINEGKPASTFTATTYAIEVVRFVLNHVSGRAIHERIAEDVQRAMGEHGALVRLDDRLIDKARRQFRQVKQD